MLHNDTIQQLIKQENYTEALPLLQEALGADESNVRVHALLAHCYYRLGEFTRSTEALSAAINMAPSEAQLYCDRGISYLMLQNRAASLKDFDLAQQLEPHNPYRYSSRAYVRDAFGDTKGAIDDYQQALALDPQDAISYNNLGLLLEKMGYQKEAQQHFSKADELEGRTAAPAAPTTAEKKVETPMPPVQKQQLSLSYYGRVLREVFTTRSGFREFMQHWLGKRS